MNDILVVGEGIEVNIKSIKQRLTYDGLLEGLPTKKLNETILIGIKEDAKKFCQLDEVYLIEPLQKQIKYDGEYPFGDPYELPNVICIVEVSYYTTFRDESKDYSGLGIIWFQENFLFPIEDAILQKIKEIPFTKICQELNY
mgnify:CR=1 FL=1